VFRTNSFVEDVWDDAFGPPPHIDVDLGQSTWTTSGRTVPDDNDPFDSLESASTSVGSTSRSPSSNSGERKVAWETKRPNTQQTSNVHKVPSMKRSKSASQMPSATSRAFGNLEEAYQQKKAQKFGRGRDRCKSDGTDKAAETSNGATKRAPNKNTPEKSDTDPSRQQQTTSAPEATRSQEHVPSPSSDAGKRTGDCGNSAEDGTAVMVNEHIKNLDAELDSTRTKDIEWRRRNFKTLLLKWHPDKNTSGMGEAETSAQANEVFKHLLARRTRYLED